MASGVGLWLCLVLCLCVSHHSQYGLCRVYACVGQQLCRSRALHGCGQGGCQGCTLTSLQQPHLLVMPLNEVEGGTPHSSQAPSVFLRSCAGVFWMLLLPGWTQLTVTNQGKANSGFAP